MKYQMEMSHLSILQRNSYLIFSILDANIMTVLKFHFIHLKNHFNYKFF